VTELLTTELALRVVHPGEGREERPPHFLFQRLRDSGPEAFVWLGLRLTDQVTSGLEAGPPIAFFSHMAKVVPFPRGDFLKPMGLQSYSRL
jgi:hypothetical protein